MGFVGFVCMCVCVREMDRERAEEGERGGGERIVVAKQLFVYGLTRDTHKICRVTK